MKLIEMKKALQIFRRKTFYVVILLIYIINSAMTINRTHNTDKLEEFYGKKNVQQNIGETEKGRKLLPASSEIVGYAKEQLGKPYKYAAKGPGRFDCSGFTGFVFRKFDILLPASARLQSQFGKEVQQQDLLPGDLVFFKSPTHKAIGHVGIVTEVSPKSIKFIHSSTGKGVVINDLLTSKHYSARYRGARRVL